MERYQDLLPVDNHEVRESAFEIKLAECQFRVDPKFLPKRHAEYWKNFPGSWGTENIEEFSRFIDNNTVVVDLGAWVGPATLVAASLGAQHVYAFEPDTQAHEFLEANYTANPQLQDRITIYKSAVSQEDGELGIGPLPGREFGESSTSTEGEHLVMVPAMSVNTLIEQCGLREAKKIVLKIDIEGGEKYILDDIVAFLKDVGVPFLFSLEVHAFHFNEKESDKVEKLLNELMQLSDSFTFRQRRTMGEQVQDQDMSKDWKTELHHQYGTFDFVIECS